MADYFKSAFRAEDRDSVISRALRALAPIEFDAVAVRGMSGAMIGPVIAHEMHKDLILVRKQGDEAHSRGSYCHHLSDIENYVIVDDFITTGHTLKEIIKCVSNLRPKAKIAGFYGYDAGFQRELFEGSVNVESHARYTGCPRFIQKNGNVLDFSKRMELEERERKQREEERKAETSKAGYIPDDRTPYERLCDLAARTTEGCVYGAENFMVQMQIAERTPMSAFFSTPTNTGKTSRIRELIEAGIVSIGPDQTIQDRIYEIKSTKPNFASWYGQTLPDDFDEHAPTGIVAQPTCIGP